LRASPSDSQGGSAGSSGRGRQTQNSIRAGQALGLTSHSRARSQDPIAQRVEQRITASLTQAARRSSATIPENPLHSQIPNSNPSSPVLPNTIPSKMPTIRKMPKPGEKNAPTFDPEKPEELGRFFDRLEEWFEEDEITADAEKKKRTVRYLDADSEIQWKAFSKFAEGTYPEFKAQVMASYPKAEEVMKGSVAALKRKIKKIGPIEVDERDELLSLIRIMTAEVGKLKLITPPIHTNRELVELFLSRLNSDFAARVAQKLSFHRTGTIGQDNAKDRNPEDMYDISEVMEMAKFTSLEYANPFGKFLSTGGVKVPETNLKLEEAVARLTDSITLQTQYNKQVDQKLANLQSFMNQPRQLPSERYQAQSGYGRGLTPSSTHMQARPPDECFYCKGPHRILDCEVAHQHLDLGWIKKIDNRLHLSDGSRIPRDGNKSMKEVVESISKPRPGVIPMSKIQDKSSLYQEDQSMASFAQTQRQSSEDSSVRALLEMIQKVGIDRVQKLLNTQGPVIEEDDEWNQNFD
jgi:hypothetical protein